MKKLCFNEKQKEYIGILGVVFFSLAVFMIISKGNLNFGLFSDNQTQWLPPKMIIMTMYTDIVFVSRKDSAYLLRTYARSINGFHDP